MTIEQRAEVGVLEGRRVTVAIGEGARPDGCALVSAGRRDVPHVWLFTNGTDRFMPLDQIVAGFEGLPAGPARAA